DASGAATAVGLQHRLEHRTKERQSGSLRRQRRAFSGGGLHRQSRLGYRRLHNYKLGGKGVDQGESLGALSLLPATIAIVLAFVTRNTVFSLAVACFIGVLVSGKGLIGFPNLLRDALGTTAFSWIFLLELFIGMLIAFFQRTGAIR